MNLAKPRSKISELRKKAGLTQKALADKLETSVHTIANWEKGRVDLWFIVTVVKLCRILNCSPEDLIDCNPDVEENKTLGLKEIRKRLGRDENSFLDQ